MDRKMFQVTNNTNGISRWYMSLSDAIEEMRNGDYLPDRDGDVLFFCVGTTLYRVIDNKEVIEWIR